MKRSSTTWCHEKLYRSMRQSTLGRHCPRTARHISCLLSLPCRGFLDSVFRDQHIFALFKICPQKLRICILGNFEALIWRRWTIQHCWQEGMLSTQRREQRRGRGPRSWLLIPISDCSSPRGEESTDWREFLTGFHKRKTERQKKAAEYLKEQGRKERIETRKEVTKSYFTALITDSRSKKSRHWRTIKISQCDNRGFRQRWWRKDRTRRARDQDPQRFNLGKSFRRCWEVDNCHCDWRFRTARTRNSRGSS